MTNDNNATTGQEMVLSPRQQMLQQRRDDMAPGQTPAAIVPHTFADVMVMCQALAAADLAPKNLRGKPTDMALVIMTGAEVGLPPMASLRLYTTWDGVPRLMAEGVRAVILQSPAVEYFEMATCDDNHATWIGKRRGRPEKSVTWTIERAKKAGLLSKDTWQKYPQDLLNARASMQLGRIIAPDVVAGMVALEEARDGDFIEAQATEAPKFAAPPRPLVPGANYEGPLATAPQGPPPGVPVGAALNAEAESIGQRAAAPGSSAASSSTPAADAKKNGGNKSRPTPASAPAPSPQPSASTSAPAAGSTSGAAPAASSPTSDPFQSTREALEQRPTSAAGGPAPQSFEASTSAAPSTGSTVTPSSGTAGETGAVHDDFGGDDPADTSPLTADEALAKVEEFERELLTGKNQREVTAMFPKWSTWSREMYAKGDQRFKNGSGELVKRMGAAYAKRKAEVPA